MFNIITPLARFNNFDKLYNHLKNKNIKWHVIIDENSNFSRQIDESWINYYICPTKGEIFYERCNDSINWFIENKITNNNEYYGILNDDDGYEEDFFIKLNNFIIETSEKELTNDLIICSMKRGDNIPKDAIPIRRHPIYTLFADPQNMRVGGVGIEQFFIKGGLLKNHRIPLTGTGDGQLITELVRTYETSYLRDAYVLFNYFEQGRWNN